MISLVVLPPVNEAADVVLHLVSFQYLDRIGQLFFGVPPKQTSSYGGLLGKGYASSSGYCNQPFQHGERADKKFLMSVWDW